MLIRGFSLDTSYHCSDCHLKCCATEFNLPLCGSEKSILSQYYPEYQFYLQSTTDGDYILRGNSCPFLTNNGLCQLHSKHLKPLTCQIYPLLFWRYSTTDTLVSIHPCRGNGFSWYSRSNSQISNPQLEELLTKANMHFESYWGENIDKNNPYAGISPTRIESQIDYYNTIPEDQLLVKITSDSNLPSRFLDSQSSSEKTLIMIKDGIVGRYLNSVLNWLIWSPVGLQLSIKNAQMIFSVAAFWLIKQTELNPKIKTTILNSTDYTEQVASYYASSILPTFWLKIVSERENKALSSFAKKVYLILMGKLSQEDLL